MGKYNENCVGETSMPDVFEEGSCGEEPVILERNVDTALKVLGINKSPRGGGGGRAWVVCKQR